VRAIFSFFTFILVVFQSSAQSKTEIKMIFTDEYPPFYFLDGQMGMYFDLIEAFEKAHPQFKILRETLSRKRIDARLSEGSVDAFSLTSTEFLPDNVHPKYIPTDIIWITSDILLSLNKTKLSHIEPKRLLGKNIGVIHGNDYMHFNVHFDSGSIHRVDAYTTSELLALLSANRIEGVIINQHGLQSHIEKNGYQTESFYIAHKALYSFNLVTMVSSEKMEFFQAFNDFIHQAKQNKLLAQLESTYAAQ
jgi:ABC-type amino acid transport substrate-binding protein